MNTQHFTQNKIQLLRSEEKFRMLFEYSPVGMAMVDHSTGAFIEVNKSLLTSTGYSKEEFLALDYWQITPEEYKEQEAQQIRDLESTGHFGPNYKEYIRKDGTRYPLRISGFILTDSDGKKVVWGIIEDLSKQRKAEEEIKRLAFYDTLTNLPNRRLLNDRLTSAMASSKRNACYGTLMFLDLDNFKPINDTHGHAAGDLLLIEAADRLKNCVREIDTVARFGGDEFVIIVSELDVDKIAAATQARLVAEKNPRLPI